MIKLRLANNEDINGLYLLNRDALGYSDIALEEVKERFHYIQGLKDHTIVVALENEDLMGYIHIQDYDTLFYEPYVEILGLCVFDKYQGQGIGKALIKYVEAKCIDRNRLNIRLGSSLKREDAHKFYEKLGYHEEKKHKIFHKKLDKIIKCEGSK